MVGGPFASYLCVPGMTVELEVMLPRLAALPRLLEPP